MATPIIKALKTEYTEIDVLTTYPEVFVNNPYVRNVVTDVNIFNYDRIINLENTSLMNPKIHQVDGYSMVALDRLLPEQEKQLQLFPTEEDKKVVDAYLSKFTEMPIIIHMRSKNPGNKGADNRNCPPEFWVKLLNELNQLNVPVIQIGTDTDFHVNTQHNIHSAINLFNVRQLHYLITKARLIVCMDSASLHIAGATNTPIVGLFTIVLPETRKPAMGNFYPIQPEIECIGCFTRAKPPVHGMLSCTRGDNKCVELFSVERIMRTVKYILEK